MRYIIAEGVVLMRPPQGPVAAYIRPFADRISGQGYALSSLRERIRLASGFSHWLASHSVRASAICSRHCAQYLQHRARQLRSRPGEELALKQFLEFLSDQGVSTPERSPAPTLTSAGRCIEGFERYLREERALSQAALTNYVPFIRQFLADRFGDRPVKLATLRARDITDFVRRCAARLHRKRAKLLTAGLRSFLRYARMRGEIRADLAAAVPCVANWSRPSIPRAISSDQVRKLLAQFDRRTAVGRRDYAILLLLARLGLRASEVVGLELEDIDWKAGSLSVCGKCGRRSQLPLPHEVGNAIVAYLQQGRPRSFSRRVFLTARAPIRGFLGPSAISTVVRHALGDARIDAPTRGAHQFRHGLATEMMRRGASLTEIGELLGHRSPETTKIYTQVDIGALRSIALPWPGGVR
jgi:site-specific recombinase XerD